MLRAKLYDLCLLLAENGSRPCGKLRLLSTGRTAQVSHSRACDRSRSLTWGYQDVLSTKTAIAAAALSLPRLQQAGSANAADLPVKAKAKPADLPFFLLIDDRVTFSYIFTGHAAGHVVDQSERHGQLQHDEAGLLVHPLRHLAVRHQLLHHLAVQVGSQRPGQPVLQRRSRREPVRRHHAGQLRGRHRNLRPVPFDLRL